MSDSYYDQLKDTLRELDMEVYAAPLNTDDMLVVLARLTPPNTALANAAETRVLYFIEKALILASEGDRDFKLRLSRPFLLKEGKLRFTWDFTIKGNVGEAVQMLQSINVPRLRTSETKDVETQLVAPSKGRVKPVTVGSL